jgi:hypothetical protein
MYHLFIILGNVARPPFAWFESTRSEIILNRLEVGAGPGRA